MLFLHRRSEGASGWVRSTKGIGAEGAGGRGRGRMVWLDQREEELNGAIIHFVRRLGWGSELQCLGIATLLTPRRARF